MLQPETTVMIGEKFTNERLESRRPQVPELGSRIAGKQAGKRIDAMSDLGVVCSYAAKLQIYYSNNFQI
jgi:hypothetical protein